MPVVNELARFVVDASYKDLSDESATQLKLRVLDSLGSAFGALSSKSIPPFANISPTPVGPSSPPAAGAGKRATRRSFVARKRPTTVPTT